MIRLADWVRQLPGFLVLAATALLVAPGDAARAESRFAVGTFDVRVLESPFGLEVRGAGGGEPLLASKPGGPFVVFSRAVERVASNLGSYHFDQEIQENATAGAVMAAEVQDGVLRVTAASTGGGPCLISVSADGEGCLRVQASAPDGRFNRCRFVFRAHPGEDFLGFGEQFNRTLHAGKRVPVWVSEQGIGRRDGGIRFPFTGSTTDSYFPLPYFLSTRGYGVLAETSARAIFDCGVAPRQDQVVIEIWEGRGALRLFDGPAPADVIRRLTSVTGRPRMLPEWGFGVWVACQGGPGRLRQFLDRLRAAGASVDAVWAQDWLGARSKLYGYDVRYHWTADEKLYPALGNFIGELHSRGIRFMGYFNTFLEPGFPEFEEAARQGFLVRKLDGAPYVQLISTFRCGLLDLSNPAAREFMAGYIRKAISLGMDGWMADFGEWLPWDGRIAAPEGAPLFHNRYPVEWAKLNREVFQAARPDGDFVVFNRSGHIGSTPVSDIIWGGDQNTSWSADDGLPSATLAGLNLGLSGVPFYHFDAGGFTSLVSLPRGDELLMRWVESGALSPLLRTHEGYWRQLNRQLDSNPRVLGHFAAMAKLHRQLQPRIIEAAREAVRTGMPLMRHLYLSYPKDPATLKITDQYLLGPSVMCAPVFARGARKRTVYFPAGSAWRHWWSGKLYQGPGTHVVDAPLGQPPLFERAASRQ